MFTIDFGATFKKAVKCVRHADWKNPVRGICIVFPGGAWLQVCPLCYFLRFYALPMQWHIWGGNPYEELRLTQAPPHVTSIQACRHGSL